jgi:hypothetical protein
MSGRGGGYLIQLLLPLTDNEGRPYEQMLFRDINASLTEKFGGLTAFSRSPAKGTWINDDHEERDDVIVVEVMAQTLDRDWWLTFRQRLEITMRQAEIVVGSQTIERL